MATYRIEWKPSALRDLKNLDRQAVPRILQSIESLAADPLGVHVRKLQGSQSVYRLRVGEYRVIYELKTARLIVLIVRVRHRKDAYRD